MDAQGHPQEEGARPGGMKASWGLLPPFAHLMALLLAALVVAAAILASNAPASLAAASVAGSAMGFLFATVTLAVLVVRIMRGEGVPVVPTSLLLIGALALCTTTWAAPIALAAVAIAEMARRHFAKAPPPPTD